MANNVTLNPGSGGATVSTADLSAVTFSYPTTAELPLCALYTGPSASTAPAPVSNANPVPTTNVPSTTGGLSVYRNISLLATGINVKASAGQVYGWKIYNNAAATRFGKATAPTVGTDTPVMTLPIPAGAGDNMSPVTGIGAFPLGIGIGATVNIADNDTTAPAANDVVVNVLYL